MTAARKLPPAPTAPRQTARKRRKPAHVLVPVRALPRFVGADVFAVAFEMPVRLVTELNMREHWRARHARTVAQRQATRLALSTLVSWRWDQQNDLRVTITRIAPKPFDRGDNAEASAKHVRDEIAAWLGVDDSSLRVDWTVDQERRGVREYGTRVEIREITPRWRVEELRRLLASAEEEASRRACSEAEARVAASVAAGGPADDEEDDVVFSAGVFSARGKGG